MVCTSVSFSSSALLEERMCNKNERDRFVSSAGMKGSPAEMGMSMGYGVSKGVLRFPFSHVYIFRGTFDRRIPTI